MGGAGGIAALHNAGRTVQLQRISFVPAQHADTAPVPEGVEVIRLGGGAQVSPDMTTSQDRRKPERGKHNNSVKELFRLEDVKLNWTTVRRAGAGLENLGNTCFLNSVLQCLTHTPPLAEVLLTAKPLGSAAEYDALRLTQQHVMKALHNRSRVISPRLHALGLRRVCRSFRRGRQEDAHEYLVALLDAMHEAALAHLNPKPPKEVAETSLIHRIFAGQTRSQVKCCECGFESNTMETFLDIALDISRASSLKHALERHTKAEVLDRENKYKCPKQGRLVRAQKTITIERAPNVLVFQLKRFEYSMYGSKIGKKVDFDTHLDLAPYMSDRRAGPQMYELFGVLVHAGHSVHSGHYFCFVRAPNGLWHRMDDVQVSQVSERVVLGQKAYILFYIRSPTNGRSASVPASAPPPMRPAPSSPRNLRVPYSEMAPRPSNTAPQPQPSAARPSENGVAERPAVKRKLSEAFAGLKQEQAVQKKVEGGLPSTPLQGKRKGLLHKMEKSAMPVLEEKQMPGDADMRARQASHVAASVSPFASFKAEEAKPALPGLADGVKASSSVRLRPRIPLVLPRLKPVLNVPGSPGGRSWKRWQEHLNVHSSSLKRKLSTSASLDGLPCHSGVSSAGRTPRAASSLRPAAAAKAVAERAHLPNGVPSSNAVDSGVARDVSPKRRRLIRQQQQAEGGVPLPSPDLSGAAAAPSAASPGEQEKGSGQQQTGPNGHSSTQEQPSEANTDSAGGSAVPVSNGDLFGLGSKQHLAPVSQPEEAPVAAVGNGPGGGAPGQTRVHTSNNPEEVRAFLHGGAGASGLNVSRWDSVDEEVVKRAEALSRKATPKGRKRDEWDAEYDRGKQKKVRNKARDEWEEGNQFQQAWNDRHRQGRGRGGGRGAAGSPGKQRGSWGSSAGRGGGRGRSPHRGTGRSPRGGGRGRR
ncbi:probable ubiquitin carboxyl-terminal hydrolase 42 at N-terminal half [Coccomyxa sp. Obi]|nr:probable ubiquitin carboxyl-terminal hydrolase 42 at N-terminal half [Coccomyxa sp. Obi]